jgi:hypothetical protein
MNEPQIRSLRELPTDIPPARDLWPAIAAATSERSRRRPPAALFGLAAALALLALGVWIGRVTLPGMAPAAPRVATLNTAAGASLPAAFLPDPRFARERAALERAAQARLAAMTPQARAKTLQSLATLERALLDIRAALGRDPANALLQELLVNTYQDEMRVLTDLQTAGGAGQEI